MDTGPSRPDRARHGDSGGWLLALETSNPSGGAEVGVARPGASPGAITDVCIEPLREVGRNEDDLLPAIDRVCTRAGLSPRDIATVAVSVGPGGYTSLRVACAAVKFIAEGVGALCVGIPTPLAVAWTLRSEVADARLGVALAGKDDSAFVTTFPLGGWVPGSAVPAGALATAKDVDVLPIDLLAADRYLPRHVAEAATARGIRMIDLRFRARACLELAGLMSPVDAVQLVPLYPREPDAVTLWRNRKTR